VCRIPEACQQHKRAARAAPIEHLQFDVAVNAYETNGVRRFVSMARLSRPLHVVEALRILRSSEAGEAENNYCY
jgi:hypothetical protein